MLERKRSKIPRLGLSVLVAAALLGCSSSGQPADSRPVSMDELVGTEFVSSGDLPEAPVADSRLSVTVGDVMPDGSAEVNLRTEPGCNSFKVQLTSRQGRAVIPGLQDPEQTLAGCVENEPNEMDDWLLNSVLGREPQFVLIDESELAVSFDDQVVGLSSE